MDELRDIYDAIVVGGGPGLNAALMLGRSRRSVLVVDVGAPRNLRAEGVPGNLVLIATRTCPSLSVLRRENDERQGKRFATAIRPPRVESVPLRRSSLHSLGGLLVRLDDRRDLLGDLGDAVPDGQKDLLARVNRPGAAQAAYLEAPK